MDTSYKHCGVDFFKLILKVRQAVRVPKIGKLLNGFIAVLAGHAGVGMDPTRRRRSRTGKAQMTG